MHATNAVDKHPFKATREALEPRLTMKAVERTTGLSVLNIIRNEQSLFSEPTALYLELLALRSGTPETALRLSYKLWGRLKREESIPYFYLRGLPPVGFTCPERTPISWYLVGLASSQIGRAKKLCCHPSTFRLYESGGQAHMPGQLVEAFVDVGLNSTVIEQLNDLGERWYVEHRV